jgi:DNA-directed RNA polymerase subunit N
MSLPVRCFSCNRVIGQHEEQFQQLCLEKNINEVLRILNIESYCCRRMFLGYVPVIDELLRFPTNIQTNDELNKEENKE